jgi:DNA-binding CsgD family transcriptional regulator
MEYKSTTELKIRRYIHTYGAEMLISWLDQFDKVIASNHYPLFRSLEKEACRSCEIALADMRMSGKTSCINAKRIISYVAANKLNLSVSSIAILLNISDRTVNYYIRDAEIWINAPKSNKIFVDSYNKVLENFKI